MRLAGAPHHQPHTDICVFLFANVNMCTAMSYNVGVKHILKQLHFVQYVCIYRDVDNTRENGALNEFT